MKKTVILLMIVLLLTISGCSDDASTPNTSTNIPKTEQIDPTINDTPEATEDTQVKYDANVPLFVCQDRSDIEGDSSTYYYYNYKGDLLNTTESAQIGFYSQNGLAPAVDPITGLIGFVDQSGVFVIDPKWCEAASFSDDGLALVAVPYGQDYGSKYGFINAQGEEIIPCSFDFATSFYPTGLAIIANEEISEVTEDLDGETYVDTCNKYGVIDITGKIIVEPQYERIEHIVGNYIICSNEKNEASETIYDLTGNLIFSQRLDDNSSYRYAISKKAIKRDTIKYDSETKEYVTITEVFDGNEYSKDANKSKYQIESRRVATTLSGYGFGVVCNNETVIPFEYDNITVQGTYIVATKYGSDLYESPTLDIYDENFQKTAEGLKYYCSNRVDPVGSQMILPNGYFAVFTSADNAEKSVHGIIDQYGNVIVPIIFSRYVRMYAYESIGGDFYLPYV